MSSSEQAFANKTAVPACVPLRQAAAYWLKLGFISFGGPAGQIGLMHEELVRRRRWISEGRFLHALNYTMVLPGPEAQQLATYIGWLLHGVRGGLIAGGLFVLPSLILLIALSWVYWRFGNVAVVAGVLYGVKPAVTTIVLLAAVRLGRRALSHALLMALALAAFIAIFVFSVPFPFIVLSAAALGWLLSRRFPAAFKPAAAAHRPAAAAPPDTATDDGSAGDKPTVSPAAAYLIDDHTPPPPHAFFCKRHTVGYILIGFILWLAAMLVLLSVQNWSSQGWVSVLPQMGWFFSKAALVTFGGAYAVLPYVFQAAVSHFGWLSTGQMMDGLALGETTPGPLIMVLAFVGFIGAANVAAPELGAQIWIAGVAGACVVTFFTFLPSFLFILVGGPAVESSRHQLHFTAPLTAITAAVVGVILNLALFFAYHVIWPQGWGQGIDIAALVITVLATVAVLWLRVGVASLIGLCAVAGVIVESVLK